MIQEQIDFEAQNVDEFSNAAGLDQDGGQR
jgi:hypothetical protein